MRLDNKWIHGDCLKELKKLPDESVHLVITSPPYHNLRVYSNDPCDLSNCETYEEYYYLLGLVIAECQRVLVPGGKFVIQYEDYNYTLGRDGKNGQESLTGDINKIFIDNGFSLWTKAFWRKYSAQRAMLAQGNLYYRNMKARDTILAANVGFVYVYKKAGRKVLDHKAVAQSLITRCVHLKKSKIICGKLQALLRGRTQFCFFGLLINTYLKHNK